MRLFQQLGNILLLPSWQHLAVSVLTGCSAAFFCYILFLQTPVFSLRRLALAFIIAAAGTASVFLLLKKHPFSRQNGYFISWRSFLLGCLLYLLVLPFYFFIPDYPALPFFQRESTLIITVETGAEPVAWSEFRRIYLNSGVEKWGPRAFQVSGGWNSQNEDLILPPDSTGQIVWQGRVGGRASLALPIPHGQLRLTTDWDGEIRQVSENANSPYIRNKNFIPPPWYTGLIYAVAWIPLLFLFFLMAGMPAIRSGMLIVLIGVLSLLQTNLQFQMLEEEFHRPLPVAIETIQLSRHLAVLNGTAPNPWQYRVFSEWAVELFLRLSSFLAGRVDTVFSALWGLRLLQNLVLLTAAFAYYSRLGISKTVSIFGVFLLAGGMMHVFYQSDLSFNTYFDIIFFLLAGVLILDEKNQWVPLLMVAASLNRETSVLIPILLIAWSRLGPITDRKRALVSGVAGLTVWGLVFLALRLYYPGVPLYKLGDELTPGLGLFRYNLTVPEAPVLLFQTLGILPLAWGMTCRNWSPFVRIGSFILLPAWILVHAFSSVWAETRLFLVPLAMVFIPAVLPFVNHRLAEFCQEN